MPHSFLSPSVGLVGAESMAVGIIRSMMWGHYTDTPSPAAVPELVIWTWLPADPGLSVSAGTESLWDLTFKIQLTCLVSAASVAQTQGLFQLTETGLLLYRLLYGLFVFV